jgi:hypothetical protein
MVKAMRLSLEANAAQLESAQAGRCDEQEQLARKAKGAKEDVVKLWKPIANKYQYPQWTAAEL